ncbi:MAG: hypothetical protein IKT47_07235 [Oscillospiraceae bacterium]|nr:hypothetical protein [Oscillospiraceae bacterium]
MNKLLALLLAIVIAAIWVFTARSADAKRAANAGTNDTMQAQVSASYEYESDVYLCSF